MRVLPNSAEQAPIGRFAREIWEFGVEALLESPNWLAPRTFGALLVGAALRSAPRLALVALRAPVLSGWCLLSFTSFTRSALALPPLTYELGASQARNGLHKEAR